MKMGNTLCKSTRLVLPILVLIALAASAQAATVINNGTISAAFDSKAITSITDTSTGQTIGFTGASSSITVDGVKLDTATLTPSATGTTPDSVIYTYNVGVRTLKVVYQLKPGWRFVNVQMFLTLPAGVTSRINSVVSFTGNITNSIYSVIQGQDPQANFTGTTFVRFSTGGVTPQENGHGIFALVQNPYVTWARSGQKITLSYTPNMDWKSAYGDFPSDPCCLGPTALSGTRFPAKMVLEYLYTQTNPLNNGFDWAEVDAVRQCMRAFLLFDPQKSTRIHVLWCQGSYIFDAATPEGQAAYKRVIDRSLEFGCDYVLYVGTNSDVSDKSENTDAWNNEYCLWFSMGQQIRKGLWDPISGPIVPSIQNILDYAASKDVKLLSYVYPSMPFKQNPEWINSTGWTDTGVRSWQDWLIENLVGFYHHTGAGGYSFDHWWVDMVRTDVTSKYAQFFGCRRVHEELRRQIPEIVMDGRQTHCWYGPWFWLAGTYPHPLNDDESPWSWRSFSDLHVDRCFAARHRYKWYWHVIGQFAPIELAPGFITHSGSPLHPRDWDYMGWKYSLLSTVGTAPFHLVVNYIPMLDDSEYAALSQADKDWFNYWMDWAEDHLEYMRNARPIISHIMIGKVDGSAAFIDDHGYIFLFNPNYRKIAGEFKLDSSIGLNTGSKFLIKQLEPQAGKLIGKPGSGLWNYGDTVSISVPGTSAMVFEVLPIESIDSPTLLNMEGAASINGTRLQIENASGEVGALEDFIVALPQGTSVSSVTVNGSPAWFKRDGNTVIGKIKFAGERFGINQQIGTYDSRFSSTTYRGSFRIPQRIFNQLNSRRTAWPVSYTAEDMYAAWTAPWRHLLFIHIADAWPEMAVSAKINGVSVPVNKGYNGSYEEAGRWMFQGYYLDLSHLQPDTTYQIEVTLPSTLAAGQFQGLFFENIETEYTREIAEDLVPPTPLVELNASDLPMGSLDTWLNSGVLGGSFGRDSTNPQVQFVAGRRCVTFDGSSRMKSTFQAPSTITNNGKYTVSVWAYNPGIGTEESMLTWSHRGGAVGTNAQFNYGTSTSSGAVSHSGTPDMGFDGGVPTAGMWHHIAVTFDGAVEKVYVDGILNAQEAKTLSIFANDYFYLGCANSGTAPVLYFSGSIASVRVYDTALTPDDISILATEQTGTTAATARSLPDGSIVTLSAKPVTCAPRDLSNARTTDYFYISEPNRSAGIRVHSGSIGQDSVTAGTRVSVTGVMRTLDTGERYIELTAPAFNELGEGVKPLYATTRSAQTDANLPALLVKLTGAVRDISPDGTWFTISDGYTQNEEVKTKITLKSNYDTTGLKPGDRIAVVGVVSPENSGSRLVIAQVVSHQ